MILKREKSVLLIIDMQDKLEKAIPNFSTVTHTLFKATQIADKLDIPRLVTEHYPEGLGKTVEKLQHENTLVKYSFAAPVQDMFTKLNDESKDTFVLGGVESHVCVFQTALTLLEQGKKVCLLSDGVASRDSGHRQQALNQLHALGAWVLPLESVAFMWLENCRHPEFKSVLALIK